VRISFRGRRSYQSSSQLASFISFLFITLHPSQRIDEGAIDHEQGNDGRPRQRKTEKRMRAKVSASEARFHLPPPSFTRLSGVKIVLKANA
jgi:hypothetical protein